MLYNYPSSSRHYWLMMQKFFPLQFSQYISIQIFSKLCPNCQIHFGSLDTNELFEMKLINMALDSKPEVKKKLEMVSYSSRFAVGLFYNPGTKIGYTWGGKYIPEDSCIRFVAIENIKRNLSKFHRLCCVL